MKSAAVLALLLAANPKLPEGVEKKTVLRVCGACHDADVVIGMLNTRRGWSDLVEEMMTRGGSATAEEKRQIVRYLFRNYPQPTIPK